MEDEIQRLTKDNVQYKRHIDMFERTKKTADVLEQQLRDAMEEKKRLSFK